ncbi:MAG: hypothetical protein ABI955_13080, partial [Nitrospirota bacterium]
YLPAPQWPIEGYVSLDYCASVEADIGFMDGFPSSRQCSLISYHITGTNRERNQNHATRQSAPIIHE